MRSLIALILAIVVLFSGELQAMPHFKPVSLRCEYLVDPLAIESPRPRLFWVIESPHRGVIQSAYQIQAAGTPEKLAAGAADIWDSGRVSARDSIQVVYGGPELISRQRVYWRVRVWDQAGRESAWSEPAMWQMGLLRPSDWRAGWIGRPSSPPADQKLPALPATMMRKVFKVARPVRRATLYATALGIYEVAIDGQRVGDHVLAPEWTDYHTRVMYQTYDVTGMLRPGEQVMAATLADGWYAGRLGISLILGKDDPLRGYYGRHPRFRAQLEIEYADGSQETVVTDGSWKCSTDGPVRKACILDGEEIDQRREPVGWQTAGFDDAGWETVSVVYDLPIQLNAQSLEPMRVTEELKPKAITEPRPGVYVVDFGQNLAGWCRLTLPPMDGRPVTLRHAEVLDEDGNIYTENLRMNALASHGPDYGARQTDVFISGDREAVFEPRFTYHGFRYVEVTGLKEPLRPEMITARVFHSACAFTGRFECSSPLLNQLMSNIVWTQRDNMPGIPTDCPQRDERMGWTGDILSFGQAACLNMDMAAFLVKWLRDLRDDQARDGRYPDFAPHPYDPDVRFSGVPAWGDAGTVVPWTVYLNYGDRRLIEEHYDSARRWVDYIATQAPEHLWTGQRGNDYGDWLNADTLKMEGFPAKGAEVPKEVFATAFYYLSADLVSRMAALIGRPAEADRYAGLAGKIKAAFNRAYVDADGRIQGDTVAGYALALDLDLLPETVVPRAVEHMVAGLARYNDHITTGFHTTVRLMIQLTRYGRVDLAYKLINNRTMPSWGYEIDQGATTIWERWDGYVRGRGFQDPGMNSFCHYSLGAVGEWMYKVILGIRLDPDHPAYRHFILRPIPGGGLTWARGHYDSIHGRIGSDWRLEKSRLVWAVTVPANTTATIHVPAASPETVREGDRPAADAEGLEFIAFKDGAAVYRAGSGQYRFTSELPATGP